MAEGRGGHVPRGEVQIRLRRDDDGVLAAGLGEDPQLRTPGGEEGRGVVGAGEDQLFDAGMGDEGASHLVLRHVHEGEHSLGHPGLAEQAAQQRPAATGLRRRLHDHGAAGDERGHGTSRRDRDGEVPRRGDQRQRSWGEGEVLLRGEALGLLRVEQREVDRLADLRVPLLEGLPGLRRHDLQQLGPVRGEGPGDPAQHQGALLDRHRRPGGLRRERRPDRLLDLRGRLPPGGAHLLLAELRAADPTGDPCGPLLVRGGGEVGVRGAAEGARQRRQRRGAQLEPVPLLGRAVLEAVGGGGVLGQGEIEGAGEALLLPGEQLLGAVEVEGRREEVLRGGVLLEAAHQIGDGHVEVPGMDDRHVQAHRPGRLVDHGLLPRRHPGEHLELDAVPGSGGDPALGHQQVGEGDVEEVVPGDAEVHGLEQRGIQRVHEDPLVLRVGGELRGQRCLRPAVHGGIHLLHREIRPLDQTHLQRRPAVGDAALGEAAHPRHRRRRIGQIGLQHDPGVELGELGPVQELLEDLQGQLEVAVLLHVEVQEGGGVGAGRLEIDRQQGLDHMVDRLRRAPQRQVLHDRGHLDRDVVDVGPGDDLPHPAQAPRGLLRAQHGLAQQVDVQGRPVGREPGQGGGQRARACVEDEVGDHPAHDGAGGGDHDGGREARSGAAEADDPAQRGGQEGRGILSQAAQLDGRRAGILGADHPVDEGQREVEPLRVAQQVRQQCGRPGDRSVSSVPDPGAHLRGDVLGAQRGRAQVVACGGRRGQRGQLGSSPRSQSSPRPAGPPARASSPVP